MIIGYSTTVLQQQSHIPAPDSETAPYLNNDEAVLWRLQDAAESVVESIESL
jgi:hypothetical protein